MRKAVLKNDRQEKDVVARIGNGRTSGASPVSAARSACGQHVDKAEAPAPAAAAAAGDPDIMERDETRQPQIRSDSGIAGTRPHPRDLPSTATLSDKPTVSILQRLKPST
ncbi:hypothetical protein ALC53_00282 [Atta colombica]|uniref:Uncharacterized protein n=1 Tax=Atta colombica TaxID=520822 RepID=A0A195BYG0_9HYME|nr:hypothetical protein ALC53_00282 [Atta colombica]